MAKPAFRAVLLLLVVPLVFAGCDHFRSFESVCAERVGPTRIDVETMPVRYETDLMRSYADLAAKDPGQPDLLTLGLVAADMKATVEYTANGIVQRRTGRYCMRPSVRVRLAYDPMTLYVAREQPEGSCEFKLTMEHELKHVRTFREFLPDAAAQIGQALRAEFGNRIEHFQSEAEANRHVEGITRSFLGPYVSESLAEVKQLQARIDAPEEYARIQLAQEACRRDDPPAQ
ncbi:MAG: hypothetical protein ABWY12_17925 [Burkholderiales bacterium]